MLPAKDNYASVVFLVAECRAIHCHQLERMTFRVHYLYGATLNANMTIRNTIPRLGYRLFNLDLDLGLNLVILTVKS